MIKSLALPSQVALPTLTTRRVHLRPMALGDAADVFAYAKVPDVLRYTTGSPPRTIDDTVRFLRDALAATDGRMWAITLRGAPTVVGAIELGLVAPTTAALHYALARTLWGQGLMTEAVDTVCRWAFETLPSLGDIETSVVDANIGSARVLEKCGFARTGIVLEEWSKEKQPVRLAIFRRDRSADIV